VSLLTAAVAGSARIDASVETKPARQPPPKSHHHHHHPSAGCFSPL